MSASHDHPAHSHDHSHADDFDRGLAFDFDRLVGRRRLLTLVGGAGLAALAACGGGDSASSSTVASSPTTGPDTTSGSSTESTTAATFPATSATDAPALASCEPIQEETAGPYPGDGSNGPNVLSESGVVRSDIRSSIGTASATAAGVELAVTLSLIDTAAGCVPLAGAAVYLWHCDQNGDYSMYSSAIADENYLRGVQESASDGTLTFTTVFPGCYAGRWPHMHFEVYGSLADATSGGSPLVTSQLALPEAICAEVYATDGYAASASNLAGTSLATDGIFADGAQSQLVTMSGAVGSGLAAALLVAV